MNSPETSSPRSPFRAPDTFVILFVVALVAWLATWIVPAGQFTSDDGTFSIDSFEYVGVQPATLLATGDEGRGLFNFLFEGLISGDRYSATVGLMAFLLIVGGAFGIILKTGAIEIGLKSLIKEPGPRTDWMIPVLFFAFSLSGAVFGMSEEAIVFVMIMAPGLGRAGYDSLTTLVLIYGGTQIGFATSWMNPFSVAVAQGIAGLDLMSGAGFRMVMWLVFTALGAGSLFVYARRIRLQPETSITFELDEWLRTDTAAQQSEDRFGIGHALIVFIVLGGVAWIAWGVSVHQYYFPEIAAQFFAMGLAAALIARVFKLNGMDFNACGEAFRDGAIQLAPAAIIVGFAKGIVVLLGGDDASDPSVLNTVLYVMAGAIDGLPTHIAAVGMYVFQGVINIFVVSGSGQAALTMPLMAPLADLLSVERQTAVLAFQLGDGLMNLVVPSSAALMGCLTAARISWPLWLSFIWKPVVAFLMLGGAFVVLAVSLGFS